MPGLEGLLRLWMAAGAEPHLAALPPLLSNSLNLGFALELVWAYTTGVSLAALALILYSVWKETK